MVVVAAVNDRSAAGAGRSLGAAGRIAVAGRGEDHGTTQSAEGEIRPRSSHRERAGLNTRPASAGAATQWRRRDSNPQPPRCKRGALPIELRPRTWTTPNQPRPGPNHQPAPARPLCRGRVPNHQPALSRAHQPRPGPEPPTGSGHATLPRPGPEPPTGFISCPSAAAGPEPSTGFIPCPSSRGRARGLKLRAPRFELGTSTLSG